VKVEELMESLEDIANSKPVAKVQLRQIALTAVEGGRIDGNLTN